MSLDLRALLLGLSLTTLFVGARAASASAAAPPAARGWIEEMKTSDRAPFEIIRWFCLDGTIRPARAGCGGVGRGHQHGDWNDQVRTLRAHGYELATVLIRLDPQRFVGPQADLTAWKQILLERFLVGFDEGWIFRGAFGYRGALQAEDEELAARRLVLALLADPAWRAPERFALLRESVRLLPLSVDETSAAGVRTRALQMAARDPAFGPLRAKIHNFPDGGDAERVRDFARTRGRPAMAAEYEALARDIEAL